MKRDTQSVAFPSWRHFPIGYIIQHFFAKIKRRVIIKFRLIILHVPKALQAFKNITFRENCDRENYEAPYLFSKFEKEQLGTALLVTVGFDHLSKRFCRV